ncbi:MAG TPA: UvrD-helicase domain-containing protein [Azospirillum sp.]|nr:UvrD-helicase domain-containing protein [Azospirillum sp.]
MSLADLRRGLRSAAPTVLVEAPAGCGKTYEAADLARDIVDELPPGGQVLLLAHTNAAVQEFSRRTQGLRSCVRVTTIDSFCLELVEPYAAALGLPTPLRRAIGPGRDRIGFGQLAPKAMELLTRAPTIARLAAARHPLIILDEHQDARPEQHAVIRRIADVGAVRLRIFGDPMQAIYERGDERSIGWDEIEREADLRFRLGIPQRWRDAPDLGDWIMFARAELCSGRPLPLRECPPCVRVVRVPDLPDPGFGRGLPHLLSQPLQSFLRRRVDGRVAILARRNAFVWGLHMAAYRGVVVNEGSDCENAYWALDQAMAAVGNPEGLSAVLVALLDRISNGMTAARQRALAKALGEQGIAVGRNQEMRAFMLAFQPIYDDPGLCAFCAVAGAILRSPPEWLTIRLPEALRLLGQLRPADGEDPRDALDATIMARKQAPRRPTRSVGTVHKAKGWEFDHVLIGGFSASHFADDLQGRRLAYVALSRATRSVEILVPGMAPSPLVS